MISACAGQRISFLGSTWHEGQVIDDSSVELWNSWQLCIKLVSLIDIWPQHTYRLLYTYMYNEKAVPKISLHFKKKAALKRHEICANFHVTCGRVSRVGCYDCNFSIWTRAGHFTTAGKSPDCAPLPSFCRQIMAIKCQGFSIQMLLQI